MYTLKTILTMLHDLEDRKEVKVRLVDTSKEEDNWMIANTADLLDSMNDRLLQRKVLNLRAEDMNRIIIKI